MGDKKAFRAELKDLINRHSMEAEFGNTADFILADYAVQCLDSFAVAVHEQKRLGYVPDAGDRPNNWGGEAPEGVAVMIDDGRRPQGYPCVESTFDCWIGQLELRVWRSVLSVNDAVVRDDHSDIKELLMTKLAVDWDSASLVDAVAKLPRVSAVQVRKSHPKEVYNTGVVVYTEWP